MIPPRIRYRTTDTSLTKVAFITTVKACRRVGASKGSFTVDWGVALRRDEADAERKLTMFPPLVG